MRRRDWLLGVVLLLAACGSRAGGPPAAGQGANTAGQVERVKPSPGTGNVQGTVVFDEKPAAGVAVTLCEKFSQYVDGCSGQLFKAQTDSDGNYVIVNVPPKTYEALTVNVFDTNDYVYAQSGILTPQTYAVPADKTLFVDTTYLWKSDLQLVNPAPGSQVSGTNLTLQWVAYPDARYYMVSVDPSDSSSPSPVTAERVDGTSFPVPTTLPAGTYQWQVEAYDAKDHKLAASGDNVHFTVSG